MMLVIISLAGVMGKHVVKWINSNNQEKADDTSLIRNCERNQSLITDDGS